MCGIKILKNENYPCVNSFLHSFILSLFHYYA